METFCSHPVTTEIGGRQSLLMQFEKVPIQVLLPIICTHFFYLAVVAKHVLQLSETMQGVYQPPGMSVQTMDSNSAFKTSATDHISLHFLDRGQAKRTSFGTDANSRVTTCFAVK